MEAAIKTLLSSCISSSPRYYNIMKEQNDLEIAADAEAELAEAREREEALEGAPWNLPGVHANKNAMLLAMGRAAMDRRQEDANEARIEALIDADDRQNDIDHE